MEEVLESKNHGTNDQICNIAQDTLPKHLLLWAPSILLSGLFQLQQPFAGFSNTTRHSLPQSLSQAASLTWKISGPSPLTPCHPLPKVLITPTQAVCFHSDTFSQASLPWSPSWPPPPQIRVGLPVLCHNPHPIFNDFWSESHILLCLQWALWGQGTCPCVHHCTPNPWRSAWKL